MHRFLRAGLILPFFFLLGACGSEKTDFVALDLPWFRVVLTDTEAVLGGSSASFNYSSSAMNIEVKDLDDCPQVSSVNTTLFIDLDSDAIYSPTKDTLLDATTLDWTAKKREFTAAGVSASSVSHKADVFLHTEVVVSDGPPIFRTKRLN